MTSKIYAVALPLATVALLSGFIFVGFLWQQVVALDEKKHQDFMALREKERKDAEKKRLDVMALREKKRKDAEKKRLDVMALLEKKRKDAKAKELYEMALREENESLEKWIACVWPEDVRKVLHDAYEEKKKTCYALLRAWQNCPEDTTSESVHGARGWTEPSSVSPDLKSVQARLSYAAPELENPWYYTRFNKATWEDIQGKTRTNEHDGNTS
jgi:hypothetical protein